MIKRKFYIHLKNSKYYLSPQYDLSRGNAGHPLFFLVINEKQKEYKN